MISSYSCSLLSRCDSHRTLTVKVVVAVLQLRAPVAVRIVGPSWCKRMLAEKEQYCQSKEWQGTARAFAGSGSRLHGQIQKAISALSVTQDGSEQACFSILLGVFMPLRFSTPITISSFPLGPVGSAFEFQAHRSPKSADPDHCDDEASIIAIAYPLSTVQAEAGSLGLPIKSICRP